MSSLLVAGGTAGLLVAMPGIIFASSELPGGWLGTSRLAPPGATAALAGYGRPGTVRPASGGQHRAQGVPAALAEQVRAVPGAGQCPVQATRGA